jgi:O-acetyl-ADP-ribose deacetylase (regulator of RNase III)
MNIVLKEVDLATGQKLQLIQGDLTQETVDAIVNAANSHLQHGGGVAAAISRRGGPQIQSESSAWVRQHGPVRCDSPAYTHAGSLPCRFVIHAVGPIWRSGDEASADRDLAAAVHGSLKLADRLELASIAFPAISTGIFGFPKPRAAGVMLTTILDYFRNDPASGLKQVRLTLFDQPTVEAFEQGWATLAHHA